MPSVAALKHSLLFPTLFSTPSDSVIISEGMCCYLVNDVFVVGMRDFIREQLGGEVVANIKEIYIGRGGMVSKRQVFKNGIGFCRAFVF